MFQLAHRGMMVGVILLRQFPTHRTRLQIKSESCRRAKKRLDLYPKYLEWKSAETTTRASMALISPGVRRSNRCASAGKALDTRAKAQHRE
jgi:hypothetical protein